MDKKYRVDHIGFIVHDVDKTASKLGILLGIEDWHIETLGPPALCDMTFRGKKADHSFRYGIGRMNGIGIELLMPVKGESVYSEFLREKGEGMHHICLLFPTEEELEKAREELINAGGELIQSGRVEGEAPYYYVEQGGVVLDLWSRRQ